MELFNKKPNPYKVQLSSWSPNVEFKSFPKFYKHLFNSIENMGVKSYDELSTSFYGHWDTKLWGKNDFNFEYIEPVARDIWSSRFYLEKELHKVKSNVQTIIWRPKSNWTIEKKKNVLLSIASASILLAEKTIILTPDWYEYGDTDELQLQCPEIWEVMFILKPLLLDGKIIVLPYTGTGHDAEMYSNRLGSPNDYLDKPLDKTKLISLGNEQALEFCNNTNLTHAPKSQEFKHQLTACLLPVLNVDNLERLLEFSYKYPSSLKRFSTTIDNLTYTNQQDPEKIKLEVVQAFAELDDRLDMYSRDVNKKTIKMIIQSAALASSLVLPASVAAVVASLTGTATLFDAVELIGSTKLSVKQQRDHNLWFPWAWNRQFLNRD